MKLHILEKVVNGNKLTFLVYFKYDDEFLVHDNIGNIGTINQIFDGNLNSQWIIDNYLIKPFLEDLVIFITKIQAIEAEKYLNENANDEYVKVLRYFQENPDCCNYDEAKKIINKL